MKWFLVASLLLVSGCYGPRGHVGPAGPQGPEAPVDPTTPFEEDVASIIEDENIYRLGLGQTALSSGLSCTLSTFTSGTRIQSTNGGNITLSGLSQVATFLSSGIFNQPDTPISAGMNALPASLRAIYLNMYLLRCQGYFVVQETGYYSFELSSDDGSLLYINDSKIIDNDNAHGVVTLLGTKYLRRGVHKFRLDYTQSAGGNQALILKTNGGFLDSRLFFH